MDKGSGSASINGAFIFNIAQTPVFGDEEEGNLKISSRYGYCLLPDNSKLYTTKFTKPTPMLEPEGFV